MDPAQPRASAVLVNGDRIVAVGAFDLNEIEVLGSVYGGRWFPVGG